MLRRDRLKARRQLAVTRAEQSLSEIVTDPNMIKRMQYAENLGKVCTFNYYFDIWHKIYLRKQNQELKIRLLYNLRIFRRWKRKWKQRKRRYRRTEKHRKKLMKLKLKRIFTAWNNEIQENQNESRWCA